MSNPLDDKARIYSVASGQLRGCTRNINWSGRNGHIESGTKANGFVTTISKFVFFFSLKTALIVFYRTEVLSKVLQSKNMTVTAALQVAQQTRTSLQRYRQIETWNELWQSCERLQLDSPEVPRTRRPSKRFDGSAAPIRQCAEKYFRMLFFEFLDNILEIMRSRLEQCGFCNSSTQ